MLVFFTSITSVNSGAYYRYAAVLKYKTAAMEKLLQKHSIWSNPEKSCDYDASPIILMIIAKVIIKKAEAFLGYDQFGFRAGLRTREAIVIMRTVCEHSLDVQKEVNFCCVDYEKAFDRVN